MTDRKNAAGAMTSHRNRDQSDKNQHSVYKHDPDAHVSLTKLDLMSARSTSANERINQAVNLYRTKVRFNGQKSPIAAY